MLVDGWREVCANCNVMFEFCRFASGWTEATDASPAQKRSIIGHVHMAEEIRSFDVVGDDGTGGRAIEASLFGVGQHGGNIENCRNEIARITDQFGSGTSGSRSIAAFRSIGSVVEQAFTASATTQFRKCQKFHSNLPSYSPWLCTSPQTLSRQSSLVEDRIDDSDEDEFHEERSGRCRPACSTRSDARGGYSADDLEPVTWSINHRHRFANASAARNAFQQPDLLKDIMAMKMFKNSAERILRRQKSDEGRACRHSTLTKHNSLEDGAGCSGHSPAKAQHTNRLRSISRSLTSSDICEMQKQLSELPKDKRGKRSRLIKSCIAQ